MSVVPSVSASPSALFAGLFGASGSSAELVPSQQSPSHVQPVSQDAPEFKSLLQKSQQQFADTTSEQVTDLAGEESPVVTAFEEAAGQLVEGSTPISGADSETEVGADTFLFPSMLTLVGAGFEQPVDAVEGEVRPVDAESDSDDSQESSTAEMISFPAIHTDDLGSADDPHSHHPPNGENSLSVDSQSEDATTLDVNVAVSDTPARQALKDLRSELDSQLGVHSSRRRFTAHDGQQEALSGRISTEAPAVPTPVLAPASAPDPRKIAQNVAPIVDVEQQGRTVDVAVAESNSLKNQTAPSSRYGDHASPLETSQAANLQPVPSASIQRESMPESSQENVQQSPVESVGSFTSASVHERQSPSEPKQTFVPNSQAETAVTKTPESKVPADADTTSGHAVSAVDTPVQQATGTVASGVASNKPVRDLEEFEPDVEETSTDSGVNSDGTQEVSTAKQQPKSFTDRNGQSFVPAQQDSVEVPSFLDKSSVVAAESVKPSPDLLPDPLQAVDADLDLLQQLLPRDSSVVNIATATSNLSQPQPQSPLGNLNLPQQIATRALSEAEVLESGDSSHFRMKLDPPELGSVMIEMQKTILGTTITVTAADPVTHQLLQDSLQNLNQNDAGEPGLFDNLTFDLATGDQGQQQQQQEDSRSDSRVVRIAENRPASTGSNTHSDTTSEVDFVA